MKVLKYLFLLLLIIFIGGAVFFSLKNGSYYISEKKTIQAPPSLIYEQIADFENWGNWNPWLSSPDVINTLGKQTTGIDGSFSFKDESGNGSMKITQLDPDKSIVSQMNYHTSFTDSESIITTTINPVQNGTEVVWSIKGEDGLKNKVMNFIFGLNLEKELKHKYKEGLNNIEKHLLTEMKKFEISNPALVDYGGGYILYKSSSTNMTQFTAEKVKSLQEIMEYMEGKNIYMFGMPMIIYDKIDEANGTVVFSTAIPVRDRVIPGSESTILCTYIEPTRAVKVTLQGTYNHLQEAWGKGEVFMAQQGYISGTQQPFEVYKTDPAITPNPAKILTEVYLPIVSND